MNAISIIGLVFSGVMLLISIINLIISNIRQLKKNTEEDEHEFASLREGILKANMKLDQVCTTTSETRTDIKSLHANIAEIDKRVSLVENKLQSVFGMIENLEKTKADKEG